MSISKLAAVFLFFCSAVYGSKFNPSDSVHTCSYFITSEPSNARVFINDSLYGLTPLKLFDFPGMSFYLRIKSDRDSNWVMAVKASGKSEVSIHALLEENYSVLNIHSDPEGADIFINGTNKGKTPVEGIKIPSGLTDVKLVKKDYITRDESFYVPQYSHHRHDISVRLKSSFSTMDLSVFSDYDKISLDGKQLDPKDLDRLKIIAGEHYISAENTLQNKRLAFDFSIDGDAHYAAVTKTKFQSTPLVLSLFVPGLGQTYEASYLKGIGIMGGFLGLAAAVYITADDYLQKKELYNLRMDKYLSSENEMDAMASKRLMLQAKDDMDKAALPKSLTVGLLAGVYIYNLIDVLLFHSAKDIADVKKMQESSGLSWQLDKDNLSVEMKIKF